MVLPFYNRIAPTVARNSNSIECGNWLLINSPFFFNLARLYFLSNFINSQMDSYSNINYSSSRQSIELPVYAEWTYKENISYSQEELEFRLVEVPKWFRTFYNNTNEKIVSQLTLEEILNLINSKKISSLNSYPIDTGIGLSQHPTYLESVKTVVDIGCCSGDLHLKMAQSFSSILQATPSSSMIEYIGIDHDLTGIMGTWNALIKEGLPKIKNILLQLHLFNKDFFQKSYVSITLDKYTMNTADFIIASHVAYYAPNVTKFVESILHFQSKNGFALFIHESEYSIGKLLPISYNAPVNSITDTQIAETLTKLGAKIYYKTVFSTIALPIGICEFIDAWKSDLCNSPACIDTQMLLEFIFQVPFSILKKKGYTENLITNLSNLAKTNNENIYLKLNIELVVPDAFTLTDQEEQQYGFYKNFQDIELASFYNSESFEL